MKIPINKVRSLLLIIFIATLLLFIYESRDDFYDIDNIDIPSFMLVVTGVSLQLFISSLRFFLNVRHFNSRVNFSTCIDYFFSGQLMNHLMPQGSAIYRTIGFKASGLLQAKQYLVTHIYFTWFTLMSSFITMLLMAPNLILEYKLAYGPNFRTLLIMGLLSLIAIFLLMPHLLQKISLNQFCNKFAQELQKSALIAQKMFINRWLFIRSCILSFLTAITEVLILYYTFHTFLTPISISEATLYFFALRISTVIQITPGNLGLRELLFGVLTEYMTGSTAIGVCASLTLRIIPNVIQIGYLMTLHSARKIKLVRQFNNSM